MGPVLFSSDPSVAGRDPSDHMPIYKRGKTYWADYWDANGVRQRKSLRTTHKRNAETLLAELVTEVTRAKLGLEAAPADARGSIEPHWVAYQEEVEASEMTQHHKNRVIKAVRDFLTTQRVVSLGQLTYALGETWLQEVKARQPQRGHAKHRKGRLSNTTVNNHRRQLVRFARWLVKTKRIKTNPFLDLPVLPKGDPRHPRRPLTHEEFGRLLEVAPPYRQLIYLWHALTGLRRTETARTVWGDVDFEKALIRVRPSTSKNRKSAELPLHPDLANLLQSYRAGELDLPRYPKPTGAPAELVFPSTPNMRTIVRDLGKAKVDYETPEGYADRHGFRVKFATDLALSGVHLVVAQKLMRHSSPAMTANIYTKVGVATHIAAVSGLAVPDAATRHTSDTASA